MNVLPLLHDIRELVVHAPTEDVGADEHLVFRRNLGKRVGDCLGDIVLPIDERADDLDVDARAASQEGKRLGDAGSEVRMRRNYHMPHWYTSFTISRAARYCRADCESAAAGSV